MFKNIPSELKSLKQWVCWKKMQTPKGKTTKIPICPMNLQNAMSNNKDTWGTYLQALECYELNKDKVDGIGFMFDTGYFGVDLDDCEDELKMEFVNGLQSYAETSQSGNGIHVICKGQLPKGRRRKSKIEMYDSGRFFVMTGNVIGNFDSIIDCTESIRQLYEKYLGEVEINDFEKTFSVDSQLEDSEVIKKASSSKNGRLFENLFGGRYESYYSSQSEADMALCNLLAFWTGRDETQMDRLFRSSGLMREKWDRKTGGSTYGRETLKRACNDCKNVYDKRFKNQEVEISYDPITGEVITKGNKEYDRNDTGNAERMYDMFGELLKYNVENKNWLIWNGRYWENDTHNKIKLLAEKVSGDMKREGFAIEDEKDRKDFFKNVNKTLNSSGKEAMIKELQHFNKIPASNNDFDKSKFLFNSSDGVYDLRTGNLMPHDRELMLSKFSDVTSRKERPVLWEKFLDEIFLGDKELINFIKKSIGYTLTGSTKEQSLFICFGDGANGKSVFLEVLSELLGGYSASAQVDSILASNSMGNGANTDIARLNGVRFVTTAEPNEGCKLNEGLIKQLTGGDKVTARFLYGKEFEYVPEFKIWLATNHRPIIRGNDRGIWRRIKMIPFNATFTKEQQDKDLKDKLLNELPQILAWAIEGCVDYFENGFEIPKSIETSVEEYKKEMDVILNFVDEVCEIKEHESIKATLLFERYSSWARANKEYEMSNTKFGREMNKNYKKVRKKDGWYYIGITLPGGNGYGYGR